MCIFLVYIHTLNPCPVKEIIIQKVKLGALTNHILQKALLLEGISSFCDYREQSTLKYVNNVDIFPSNTMHSL